ncbi:MAG TPA: polymer-forming cytoskeletal protein, partial [Methylophilaceae bacterium]
MLNKQGLFSRRNPSEDVRPSTINSLSQTNGLDKTDPHAKHGAKSALQPAPGHLAALESATTVTAHTDKQQSAVAETTKAEQGGSRLIVGPDVKLKGAEIEDCDTLVVEGRVEATMDSRVIQITSNGSFSGKVGIDVAEIYGTFEGELTARNQLIIHSSGRVSGKIRYG